MPACNSADTGRAAADVISSAYNRNPCCVPRAFIRASRRKQQLFCLSKHIFTRFISMHSIYSEFNTSYSKGRTVYIKLFLSQTGVDATLKGLGIYPLLSAKCSLLECLCVFSASLSVYVCLEVGFCYFDLAFLKLYWLTFFFLRFTCSICSCNHI